MKKILLITLMATVPILAQGKKGAKPAKKDLPVAAVAQPETVAPAAPAEKKEEVKPWTLGGYILFNVPSGDIVNNRTNIDKGGPMIGGHGLYNFSHVSIGLGMVLLPIYMENTGTSPVTARFINYDAMFRYRLGGAYIGVMAGYALGIAGTDSNVVGTISNGIAYGGGLGYVINVGSVGIHLGCDVRQITYWIPNSGGQTSNIMNITPKVGVDFTF